MDGGCSLPQLECTARLTTHTPRPLHNSTAAATTATSAAPTQPGRSLACRLHAQPQTPNPFSDATAPDDLAHLLLLGSSQTAGLVGGLPRVKHVHRCRCGSFPDHSRRSCMGRHLLGALHPPGSLSFCIGRDLSQSSQITTSPPACAGALQPSRQAWRDRPDLHMMQRKPRQHRKALLGLQPETRVLISGLRSGASEFCPRPCSRPSSGPELPHSRAHSVIPPTPGCTMPASAAAAPSSAQRRRRPDCMRQAWLDPAAEH